MQNLSLASVMQVNRASSPGLTLTASFSLFTGKPFSVNFEIGADDGELSNSHGGKETHHLVW